MVQAKYLLFFLSGGLYGMYPELNIPLDNILQILLEQPHIYFTPDEKKILQDVNEHRKTSSVFKLHYMKKKLDEMICSKLKRSDKATTAFLWAGELQSFAHNKMLLGMNDAIQNDLTVCMLKKVQNYVYTAIIVGAGLLIAYHLKSSMQEFEK